MFLEVEGNGCVLANRFEDLWVTNNFKSHTSERVNDVGLMLVFTINSSANFCISLRRLRLRRAERRAEKGQNLR